MQVDLSWIDRTIVTTTNDNQAMRDSFLQSGNYLNFAAIKFGEGRLHAINHKLLWTITLWLNRFSGE